MARGVTIGLYLLSLPAWLVAAQSVASQAYAPATGTCPDGFNLVRMAGSPGNQSLSASETKYIQARRTQVIPQAWRTYLANVEATNVTLPSYVSSILNGFSSETPNFGIALSGGGYRGAIFGAGVLNALDGRNASSNGAGLGGLLQAATYWSGLSGGSWLIASSSQANFPTTQDLVFGSSDPTASNDTWGGWHTDFDLLAPSSDAATNIAYLTDLATELKGKYDAGFPVTLIDFWARALARHFTNGTFASNFFDESGSHGAGVPWSQIIDTEAWTTRQLPFPIMVADISDPSQNKSNTVSGDFVPLSNPIMEFNVFETGSYDSLLSAFTPTKFLGTTNNSVCVTNYEQISFLIGTSSAVFGEFNITHKLSSLLGPEISTFSSLLPETGIELDAASIPNAFYGVAPKTFISSNQQLLTLVDGGADGENTPFQPLLVKARGVDVILATDASADVNNFAAGSSLVVTQNRTKFLSPEYSFPEVPTSVGEFIAQNLSTRPTFFGCNTTSGNVTTPLVIYLANGGPPFNGEEPVTNTSTFQSAYSLSQVQAMLDQSFTIATQGFPQNSSATSDPEWAACLACAIVDRARERAGKTRDGICANCFSRYCWDGSTLGAGATSGDGVTAKGPRAS